jgi:hypothetical protein
MTVAESHYGYVRSSNSGHVMRLDADGQLHWSTGWWIQGGFPWIILMKVVAL